MTALLRTSADFDTVPDGATIAAVEVPDPGFMESWRRVTFWRKYGREFVQLDPGDRMDGEESKPSGYLENFLRGFGSRTAAPGVALVLGEGDQIAATSVGDLASGSLIQVPGQEYPHIALGAGRWEYLDPADPDDGEYDILTGNLISGETTVQVLYRRGDEVTAGFVLDVSAPETESVRAASDMVEPREQNISEMSPCAQAYVQEYGRLPNGRAEQDRYAAFRRGYELGGMSGRRQAYADVAKYAGVHA